MDYPFRGSRNQRHVIVTGTLEIVDMAGEEVSDVTRVEYGDTFAAMSGAVGLDEAGVELATWTDPRTAPVDGFWVELVAQDETGFWVRVTRDAGAGEVTFSWAWEVRGEIA